MSLKPICLPCKRFYSPEKNGFAFTEGMPRYGSAAPGNAEPTSWQPYKLWRGDLWKCHGCGSLIIVGTGQAPVSEHYMPSFEATAKEFGHDRVQINDC